MKLFNEKFLKEYVLSGKSCFWCGEEFRRSDNLDSEHVIPEWFLKAGGVNDKSGILPNGWKGKYSKRLIKVHRKCNIELNNIFEAPISSVFRSGWSEFKKFCKTRSGKRLVYRWMLLISVKSRIFDKTIRYYPNQTKPGLSMGATTNIQRLTRDLNAVRRNYLDNDEIGMGSLIFKFVRHDVHDGDNFAFLHLDHEAALFLQAKSIVIISIVDDRGQCARYFSQYLAAYNAQYSLLDLFQIREAFSAALALRFKLQIDEYNHNRKSKIILQRPARQYLQNSLQAQKDFFGSILLLTLRQQIAELIYDKQDRDLVVSYVIEGRITFFGKPHWANIMLNMKPLNLSRDDLDDFYFSFFDGLNRMVSMRMADFYNLGRIEKAMPIPAKKKGGR